MRSKSALHFGLVFAALAVTSASPALAASYTFAGSTFEQDNTPDLLSLLGGGATIGGATFSNGFPTDITQSVGFLDTAPGFDPLLSLGRQAFAQTGIDQPGGGNCVGACAVNIPAGNSGTTIRHGLEASWSGNRVLQNNVGNDFVIYESSSDVGSSAGDEGFMVRLGLVGGAFTDWLYQPVDSRALYTGALANPPNGATATEFDISDFGLSAVAQVLLIQIANLTSADRIGLNGVVNFNGIGLPHGFANGSLDPDPLYIGIMSNVAPIPVPAALPLFASALGFMGYLGWRRKKRKLQFA